MGQAVDSSAAVVASGKRAKSFGIEAPQECDRLEILAPAEPVGNPAAGRPAVVEIKHRGDRIDAQSVDAVAVEPEQAVGEQEVGDLGASEIVDQRVPVEVPALLRVGMLVERGAVETAEPVRIVGKMARHPIEDHAEAGPMAGRDQLGKIRRRSEPAGRSEQAGRLIAPGAVERMLADRQEFHMGETHVARVGRAIPPPARDR